MDRNYPGDRELVRKLVEAFWRDLVLRGYRMGAQGSTAADAMPAPRDASRAFREQTEALAAQLPPEQERAFLDLVEQKDSRCFQEHQSNHKAFCRRLGLTARDFRAAHRSAPAYRRQSIDPRWGCFLSQRCWWNCKPATAEEGGKGHL